MAITPSVTAFFRGLTKTRNHDFSNNLRSRCSLNFKNIQSRGRAYPLSLNNRPTLNPRYPCPLFPVHPLDRSALRDPVHSRLALAVYRVADTGKIDQYKMEEPARGATTRYVPVYSILVFQARVQCGGAYFQWSEGVALILCGLGIRNFTVSVTVRIASEEANLRRERAYLNKLNLALVQVSDHKLQYSIQYDTYHWI